MHGGRISRPVDSYKSTGISRTQFRVYFLSLSTSISISVPRRGQTVQLDDSIRNIKPCHDSTHREQQTHDPTENLLPSATCRRRIWSPLGRRGGTGGRRGGGLPTWPRGRGRSSSNINLLEGRDQLLLCGAAKQANVDSTSNGTKCHTQKTPRA